jgi:AraC-like DNA-binding protein
MGTLLSTHDVCEQEGFNYWRDLICDVFVQLEANPVGTRPFHGAIDNNRLAFMQVSDVISCGQRVVRSRRQIAKSTEDYFLVNFQLYGESKIEQDGRTAYLQPGDWALYDSTRPYELAFVDEFSQLVLQMPRQNLRARLAIPEAVTAIAISGRSGLGRVTYDFARSMRREIDNIAPRQSNDLANTMADLLGACLGELRFNRPGKPYNHTVKVLEIKSFIRERLADPHLSIEMIARVFNLSPRYLHLLFQQEETTLTQFIRHLRLEKCKQDLLDPLQQHRTIIDIAFSWGFNDAAHFSHVFKKQFGISARAFRGKI